MIKHEGSDFYSGYDDGAEDASLGHPFECTDPKGSAYHRGYVAGYGETERRLAPQRGLG